MPQYAAMSHDVDEYYAEAVKYAGLVVDNPESRRSSVSTTTCSIFTTSSGGPDPSISSSCRWTARENRRAVFSKISKMYLPYVSGATIYLKQGDSDQMVPTHDGWGEYRTALSFYDAFASGDRRHDWLRIVDSGCTTPRAMGRFRRPTAN